MKIHESLGVFLVSAGLIGAGTVLETTQLGTRSGNDVLPWICVLVAVALLSIAGICFVSGVSIPQLSTRQRWGLWGIISALFAFGLFLDWGLYHRDVERFWSVLFEWSGIVLIYGALLLMPLVVRRSGSTPTS